MGFSVWSRMKVNNLSLRHSCVGRKSYHVKVEKVLILSSQSRYFNKHQDTVSKHCGASTGRRRQCFSYGCHGRIIISYNHKCTMNPPSKHSQKWVALKTISTIRAKREPTPTQTDPHCRLASLLAFLGLRVSDVSFLFWRIIFFSFMCSRIGPNSYSGRPCHGYIKLPAISPPKIIPPPATAAQLLST